VARGGTGRTGRSGAPSKSGRKAYQPRDVDTSQFSSLEDALTKVEPGKRYIELARPLLDLGDGLPLTMPIMFWFAMLSHCEGLHGALAREIRQSNPNAVYPLMRAFAEAVLMVIYVLDHPRYVEVLAQRPEELPRDGPKRKSPQALINYASTHAPGMKAVYADLSEATHFGSIAMWASHRLEKQEDDGTYRFSWQSAPRWREEQQALAACAQTLELAQAMTHYLGEFLHRHVLPAHPGVPRL
jgi:hypothetical protein